MLSFAEKTRPIFKDDLNVNIDHKKYPIVFIVGGFLQNYMSRLCPSVRKYVIFWYHIFDDSRFLKLNISNTFINKDMKNATRLCY